ncbi:hypothetical protein UPYG_G00272820 [Umbra pygmaea]|uniref:Uncharacterized protein n=1 Tax=Umbra pygmaea TaxID=75934 RepID=A0ABD0WC10_UMBPY
MTSRCLKEALLAADSTTTEAGKQLSLHSRFIALERGQCCCNREHHFTNLMMLKSQHAPAQWAEEPCGRLAF